MTNIIMLFEGNLNSVFKTAYRLAPTTKPQRIPSGWFAVRVTSVCCSLRAMILSVTGRQRSALIFFIMMAYQDSRKKSD